MGLFGGSDKKKAGKSGTTIVSAGTKIEGDLKLDDNLHVDGTVKGTITSEADITIGQNGHVQGDVRSRHLTVSGELTGKVDCQCMEIVAGGQVKGEVKSEEIIIESGASFEGQSQRKSQEPVAMLGHDGAADIKALASKISSGEITTP